MRLEREQPRPMSGFFKLLEAKESDGSLAEVQAEVFEFRSEPPTEREWQKWDAASTKEPTVN
jgi:hypothetical protein